MAMRYCPDALGSNQLTAECLHSAGGIPYSHHLLYGKMGNAEVGSRFLPWKLGIGHREQGNRQCLLSQPKRRSNRTAHHSSCSHYRNPRGYCSGLWKYKQLNHQSIFFFFKPHSNFNAETNFMKFGDPPISGIGRDARRDKLALRREDALESRRPWAPAVHLPALPGVWSLTSGLVEPPTPDTFPSIRNPKGMA